MNTSQLLHAVALGAMLSGGLAICGCGDSAPSTSSTTVEKTIVIVPATTPPKTEVSVTTNPAPAASPK